MRVNKYSHKSAGDKFLSSMYITRWDQLGYLLVRRIKNLFCKIVSKEETNFIPGRYTGGKKNNTG